MTIIYGINKKKATEVNQEDLFNSVLKVYKSLKGAKCYCKIGSDTISDKVFYNTALHNNTLVVKSSEIKNKGLFTEFIFEI